MYVPVVSRLLHPHCKFMYILCYPPTLTDPLIRELRFIFCSRVVL